MIGFEPTIDHSLGDPISFSDFAAAIMNYKRLAIAISGICAVSCIILFFISVAKLSVSSGNDAARSRAMKGILFSGIGLLIFGGATAIIGIAWNFFD